MGVRPEAWNVDQWDAKTGREPISGNVTVHPDGKSMNHKGTKKFKNNSQAAILGNRLS